MKFLFSFLSNVLIICLFVYTKLLPHKDKLNLQYKKTFKLFKYVFDPIINFLTKFIPPFQVGQGIALDLTQIILLILLLMVLNFI
jgi:hypothetical protein